MVTGAVHGSGARKRQVKACLLLETALGRTSGVTNSEKCRGFSRTFAQPVVAYDRLVETAIAKIAKRVFMVRFPSV
jgi:hypothetical protein